MFVPWPLPSKLPTHPCLPSLVCCLSAASLVSEAETEWSDGVAATCKAQQQRYGVGFWALVKTSPVWAICIAQYTGAWQ